jgi:hypothetical protein
MTLHCRLATLRHFKLMVTRPQQWAERLKDIDGGKEKDEWLKEEMRKVAGKCQECHKQYQRGAKYTTEKNGIPWKQCSMDFHHTEYSRKNCYKYLGSVRVSESKCPNLIVKSIYRVLKSFAKCKLVCGIDNDCHRDLHNK